MGLPVSRRLDLGLAVEGAAWFGVWDSGLSADPRSFDARCCGACRVYRQLCTDFLFAAEEQSARTSSGILGLPHRNAYRRGTSAPRSTQVGLSRSTPGKLVSYQEGHQRGKGRDIGYALAADSCEETNNVEACTITALDVILLSQSKPQRFLAESVGFFGSGHSAGYPTERITQLTSD